jgi:hypothetical protein
MGWHNTEKDITDPDYLHLEENPFHIPGLKKAEIDFDCKHYRWHKVKRWFGRIWATTRHPFLVYRFHKGVRIADARLGEEAEEATKRHENRKDQIAEFLLRPDPLTGLQYLHRSEIAKMREVFWEKDQEAHVPHNVDFDVNDEV